MFHVFPDLLSSEAVDAFIAHIRSLQPSKDAPVTLNMGALRTRVDGVPPLPLLAAVEAGLRRATGDDAACLEMSGHFYTTVGGGKIPAHTDGPSFHSARTCSQGHACAHTPSTPSTHSLLIYLTTCDTGATTVESRGRDRVQTKIAPQRGTGLLMSHTTKHGVEDFVPTEEVPVRVVALFRVWCVPTKSLRDPATTTTAAPVPNP